MPDNRTYAGTAKYIAQNPPLFSTFYNFDNLLQVTVYPIKLGHNTLEAHKLYANFWW